MTLPPCRRTRLATLAALAACLYFTVLGLCIIPCLGIEGDEPLFAAPLFRPFAADSVLAFRNWRLPVMLNSYLGCLKTWIYWPIFHLFGAGVFAMRVPMLLAGTAGIWLFFLLVRHIAGVRAALIATGLLAADGAYLLTVCFDWGPVALQHLLLAGAFLLLVRFHREGRRHLLFWGFFLIGLVLWDKALAVWMLSGIALGLVCVCPRQLRALTNPRNLTLAAAAFALGALPLLAYNTSRQLVTLRGNMSRDTDHFPVKIRVLMATAEGDGLFGWLVNPDAATPHPHKPSNALQSASAAIADFAGHPTRHLLVYAVLVSLLLTPLAAGDARRAILAAAMALAAAWIQMALTANAGTSVHHVILLWPLPQMIVGISLAAASRRIPRYGLPIVSAVACVAIFSAALVGNEYYYAAWRNGGPPWWTDGIFALARAMRGVPAGRVYCVDWGIATPLQLLENGKLPLLVDFPSAAEYDAVQREVFGRMIADSGTIFVAHTPAFENFAGANQRLLSFAAHSGYRPQLLIAASDSFGRPAFEVYRFTPD